MTETFQHYTVMLKETVDGLNIKSDGVYVDCTLGGAGHSEYLLSQLSSKGHLYAFDQDQKAIDHAKLRLASYVEQGMVTFIKANFRELEERLSEYVDNFPNKLLVKSNEYEKQNQSKQLVSLSKSLNKSSQLPQEEKAGILQKEFFKLCGLQ